MRFVVGLASLIALAGCAGTLRVIGEDQAIGPVSIFDDVALSAIDRACLTSDEAGMRILGMGDTSSDRRVGRARVQACDLVARFNAFPTPSTPVGAQQYFAYGASLSDLFCYSWFAQLDGARRTSRQAHDFVTGIGALTTGIQALTGVEPPAIGIASAIFGQSATGFDHLDRNYMLSPNLVTVYQSLFAFRERYYAQLRADNAIQDEASAYRYLMQYESTCTSLGVQHFIEASVANAGRGESTPTPATIPAEAQADIAALAAWIEGRLSLDAPISSELMDLIVARWIILPEPLPESATQAEKDARAQMTAQVEADLQEIQIGSQSAGALLDALPAANRNAIIARIRANPQLEYLKQRAEAYLTAHRPSQAPAAAPD